MTMMDSSKGLLHSNLKHNVFCRLFFCQIIALYRTYVSRGESVQQVSPAAGDILELVSTYNFN